MNWFPSACIVLSLVTAYSGQQRQPTKQQQTEQPKPLPATQSGAAPQIAHGQQSGKVGQPSKAPPAASPKGFWDLEFSDYIDMATLIVTGAFLWFTILTWHAMQEANRISKKANEDSAAETEESLALTRESNAATRSQRDTLAAALRAWLVLSTIPPWNYRKNSPPTVRVAFTNTGFSPALAVHPHGEMKLAPNADFLEHSTERCRDKHEPLSVMSVGAGQQLQFEVIGLNLTDDELHSVANGTLNVYLYGCVDYIDAFGNERRTLYAALKETAISEWTSIAKHNEQT